MDYMFGAGFLGTRAPLFMDVVTVIVFFLPLLVWGGIQMGRKQRYGLHMIYNAVLFVVSVSVVAWFEFGARVGGGFQVFIKESTLPESFVFGFLLFHIAIAVITVIWWIKTLSQAYISYQSARLPGAQSAAHIRDGKRTALGIFLTSLTGVIVYLLLFVF